MKKPTAADALPTIAEWNDWLAGFRTSPRPALATDQGNLHPLYLLAQDQDRRATEKQGKQL